MTYALIETVMCLFNCHTAFHSISIWRKGLLLQMASLSHPAMAQSEATTGNYDCPKPLTIATDSISVTLCMGTPQRPPVSATTERTCALCITRNVLANVYVVIPAQNPHLARM